MPSKINKNLLVTIVVVFAAAALVLGGLFLVKWRGDAQRHVRAGDALLAEGEPLQAKWQYGRAVRKSPGNLVYLAKLKEALLLLVPLTDEEATQYYDEYLTYLVHATRQYPEDAELHLASLEALYRTARLTDEPRYWQRLEGASNRMLDRLPPEDPARLRGMLYRGICGLRTKDQMLTSNIDDEGRIRFPGEGDLRMVLEADPDNDLAWGALAFGRMAVARRLELEGRFSQAKKNLALAEQTFEAAKAASPDGIAVSLTVVRDLVIQRIVAANAQERDPGMVSAEDLALINAELEEAIAHLLGVIDPNRDKLYMTEAVRLIALGDLDRGRLRAIDLLEAHLAVYPDDLEKRLLIANYQFQEQMPEAATASAGHILAATNFPVSLKARQQFHARRQAARVIFDVSFYQWIQAEAGADEPALREAVVAARETLQEHLGGETDHPYALDADGKIHFGDGNFRQAVTSLEQLVTRQDPPNPETLRLSASSLEEIGQVGLARERLTQAVEIEPIFLGNHLAKSSLEARMGLFGEALATLQALPREIQDNNEIVIEYAESMRLMLRNDEGGATLTDSTLQAIATAQESLRTGDTEEARTLLLGASEQAGHADVRLLVALANVEVTLGDPTAALVHVHRALEIRPEDQRLDEMRIRLETSDLVEMISRFVELEFDDPEDQAVMKIVNLGALAMAQSVLAQRLEVTGDMDASAEARETSELAKRESSRLRASLSDAAASSRELIVHDFLFALEARAWDEVIACIERVKDANTDEDDGELMQAQYELARGGEALKLGRGDEADRWFELAVATARVATELIPYNDMAWRTLGIASEHLGRDTTARSAMAEAYRCNPNSLDTIRRYSDLLLRPGGEPVRALRILSGATRLYSNDRSLYDAWLEAEAAHGDRARVIAIRRGLRSTDPTDRRNNLRLALLLASTSPGRSTILDARGEQAISSLAWERISTERKKEIIRTEQKRWLDEVDVILTSIEGTEDPDLASASVRARILLEIGDYDGADALLQAFLDRHVDDPQYISMVIFVAQIQIDTDHTMQSIQLLKANRDRQGSRRAIDAALGNIHFAMGRHQEAHDAYRLVLASRDDTTLRARLIESLVKLGRLEEAETELERLSGATNPDYASEMLAAMLWSSRADALASTGEMQRAEMAIKRFRGALGRAERLDPANPTPYQSLAASLLDEYTLTRVPALLDEALAIVDRGARSVDGSEALTITRVDVLQLKGDLILAIDEMRQMLRREPESRAVRQRLITAHLDLGNVDRAIEVLQEGIDLDPGGSVWYVALGDLHRATRGDDGAAIEAYLTAYTRRPRRSLLLKINDATRTTTAWNYDLAATVATANQALLEQEPILIGLYAKALHGLGRHDEAIEQMTRAHAKYRDHIEQGWMPGTVLWSWYSDLTVLFRGDPRGAESFVTGLAGVGASPIERAGLASIWSAADAQGMHRAIDLMHEAVAGAEAVGDDLVPLLLMRRGAYEIRAEDFEASVRTYLQVLQFNPESVPALNNYAYVLGVNLGQPQQALPNAIKAVSLQPRNPELLDTLAELHLMLGDQPRAVEALLQQLRLTPTDPVLLARIALLYTDGMDRADLALPLAEQALLLRPRSPVMLDQVGWVYFRSGQVVRGEDYLRQSIREKPSAGAYLHLVRVFLADDRLEQATDRLRLAEGLAVDPDTRAEVAQLLDDIRRRQDG